MISEGEFEPDRRQAFAAVGMGVAAMTVTGLQPLILGVLSRAGHFSAALGHAALLCELATMGVTVALAGLLIPPRRLRLLGALAALAYGAFNLLGGVVGEEALISVRMLAGVSSGLMIWIAIGMLARRAHPEPWAAVFVLGQAVGQMGLAAVTTALALPAFGPPGAVGVSVCVAILAAAGAAALPRAYPELGGGRLPSGAGWVGLLALLLYVTASTGVWFHMRELARLTGAGPGLASLAVVANLIGQLAGAGTSVVLARRLGHFQAVAGACLLALSAWSVVMLHPPAGVFLAAFVGSGFASMLLGTRLFSFLTAIDPSRRAASVSGSAQLVGAAIGPVLAGAGAAAGLGAGPVLSLVLVGVSLTLAAGLQRRWRGPTPLALTPAGSAPPAP